MTTVNIEQLPRPPPKPQQQQRTIFGGTRKRPRDLAFHNPPRPDPMVQKAIQKQHLAELEVKKSAGDLITDGACFFTKDETHAKKFKAEMSKSAGVDVLLGGQLHWVSTMPEFLQLAILIGEKYVTSAIKS